MCAWTAFSGDFRARPVEPEPAGEDMYEGIDDEAEEQDSATPQVGCRVAARGRVVAVWLAARHAHGDLSGDVNPPLL